MTTNWYGSAQSAKQAPRSANGQRSLNAVGGMRHEVRAIYGSTDRATVDHSNDTLCKLAPASAHFTDSPAYAGAVYSQNVYRYAAHEEPITRQFASAHSTPELEPLSVEFYLRRAAQHGMTLVDYCAMLNIKL